MEKKRIKSWCILGGLLAFFLGMLAAFGVGIYNDSEQYITMHIHREPLYPLFLAFFRMLCGEGYLTAAAAAQNIMTAFGIWVLAEYIAAYFKLRLWEELAVVFLQIVPHLMTRYVSALHIFLENSVMSEALCIPLFHFFLYFLLRMVYGRRTRDKALSLIFAFLLSMTRGQMMSTILMWMAVVLLQTLLQDGACGKSGAPGQPGVLGKAGEDGGGSVLPKGTRQEDSYCKKSGFGRRAKSLALPVAAVILVFCLRSLAVHVYNYAVTGYFMGNTYGRVNTLTNVIYACDREDGEVFGEGSLEREFFERFYDEADALEANYRYGGDTFSERAGHLEKMHDVLKFQVLEADLSAYYFGLGKVDYYQQSSMSDEMAGRMLGRLLPVCFGQWLYDYLLLCTYGFIRSVAVVHPLANWAALLFYVAAAGLAAWQVRRLKRSDAACAMGIALLFIAANVCATSLTIMCLSRYMVYGFSFFYTAGFLLAREWLQTVSGTRGAARMQDKKNKNKRG